MSRPTCRTCGESKPHSEFSVHSRGILRKDCNPCRNSREAARRYGVTVDEVLALSEAQGHRCAVCKTHKDDLVHGTFKHNPLVIDHDHRTGRVRGLLCPTCNIGLGQFKDDVNLLANAISYLTSTP
jgi:hypothetical protein